MIRFVATTAIMAAIGVAGSAAQAADKTNSTPDAKASIYVIPVDTISGGCNGALIGDKVKVRLKGIRIDQDGTLKLKRNIKYDVNDDDLNEIGEGDVSRDIQDVTPTPFDILAGKAIEKKLLQVKIVVFPGVGAGFIEDPVDSKGAYIRAGSGQGTYFCGLSKITNKDGRKAITFFVKPGAGKSVGFAFGIKVPEVDIDGNPTGRVLPLIIDPNVKNDG